MNALWRNHRAAKASERGMLAARLRAVRHSGWGYTAVVMAMVLVVTPRMAFAQTTWDGSNSNSWNSNKNWSGNAVPNATSDVVFADVWGASGGTSLTLGAGQAAKTVTIATGTTFSLGGAFALTLSATNGLTRTAASSGTQTFSFTTLTMGTNQTWSVDGAGQMVVSAVIDDGASTFDLTKTGAGVLVLSGASTFGGTTTASGGTLVLGNAAALQNSTLSTAGSGTVSFGSLTTSTFGGLVGSGNLALTNTSAGAVALSVGGNNASTTYSGTLSGGGSLVKTGSTGQLTLSGNNTYTGTTAIASGTLSTGSVVVAGGASGLGNATTAVTLGNAANEGTLSYTGNTATFTRGFALGAGGGQVLVTTAGQTLTIGGTGNVTSTSGTFTAGGAGNTTVSSTLSLGTGGLVKEGSGLLTVSAANAYSGSTSVTSGTLRATTSGSALGSGGLTLGGGNLELANDTGLAFNRNTTVTTSGTIFSERLTAGTGVTHTLGTLSIGAQTLTLDTDASVTGGTAGLTFGAVTMTGAATLNAAAGTQLTTGTVTGNFGLAIGGAGDTTIAGFNPATAAQTLTKSGAGTLTLAGTSSYTGLTTISGGTLAYGIANAINSGGITVNGGVLDVRTFNDSVGTVTLTSGNIVGTTGTLTSSANFQTTSGTISAVLGGGATVGIVQGAGTTVLTAANTFTGTSSIASGGVLNLQNANALGTSGSAVTVASGGALQLQGTGSTAYAAKPLSLSGTATSGNGALQNISGTNTWQGGVTLAGASRINSAAGLLTLTGSVAGTNQSLTVGGAGNTTLGGTLSLGTGALTKDGSGTLTILNASTYSGSTGIAAGVVNVQNGSALGTSGTVTVASGAELQLQNGVTINRNLSLAGTGVSGSGGLRSISGANTYSGTITTTAGIGLGVDSGTLTLSGSLGGNNSFTKSGAGLLVLTGTDAITGAHTINSGTFQIGSTGVLSPGGGVVMNVNNATFDLNGRNATIGANGNATASLTGGLISTASGTLSLFSTGTFTTVTTNASANASTISGNLSLGGTSAVFTINDGAAADDLVISAVISNGGLTKNGAGQLKLTGSSTYGGATTVNAGTLLLGGASVLSGSTAVTVAGGVLDNGGFANSVASFTITSGSYLGSGTLTAGTYSLQGGTVSGTLGAGTLTVAANSALGGASGASAVNLNSGTLTLAGANVLSATAAVTGSASGALALGGNQTIGSLSGSAAVALGSSTLTVGGLNTSTTYSGTMSGAGGLTKTGTGQFTLTGTQAYGGATTVSGGTLALGSSGVLSGSTAVAVAGGVLNLSTFSNTVGGFSITSGTVAGSGTLTTGTYTLGGGTVLANLGAGTVHVTANTILGGTSQAGTINLDAETLTLSNANALASSAAVTGSAGGVLSLGGNQTIGSLSGSAAVALGSNTLTTGGGNASTTLSGAISGAGNLIKAGSGTFTLMGNNSYSGTTSINAGTIGVSSVASGSTNQSLGTGIAVTLGAAGASSGRLQYLGGSGTLSKNVFALGNGTDTIQNAGTGLLTLSGTLQKNGTVLRLQGGTQGITVTGAITGTSPNSDLAVQNGLTTLSATNTYTGPTFINSSGTLALGVANAIPSNSLVTIGGTFAGGDGGAGTLAMGSFADAIGGLAFSGSGGTVRMAPTAGQTSAVLLSSTGSIVLNGAPSTLDLTGMAASAGVYKLLSAGTLTGTFGAVTGLDSSYVLRYGTLTANELDAQRKADQATTFTMTTGTVSRALVGTTVAVSGSITNSTPTGGTNLAVSLSSDGVLTVGSLASGTSSLAPQASTTVSGSIQAGNTSGTRSWSVVNTDTSAITTTSTASGSLQVVDQRSFTVTTSTIALGRYLIAGTLPTGTTGVASSGVNATTATATLGGFTSSNGYMLALTSGTNVFDGATASQTAGYTVTGSAISAGTLSGSFSSTVAAEFGSIGPVVVAYTANPVNQRVFITSTSTLALGNVHQGASIGAPTLVVTSTGLNAVTASGTLGSFTGGPGGFELATTDPIAFLGTSGTQTATYTLAGPTSTLGAINGTFSSAVAGEFGGVPNVTVAVTGSVYSGQATWATNGGGNWGTLSGTGANAFGANWGANQGSPGLDPSYADTDTATFGSALTSGTAAINTNGANISLKAITFDNAAGSYEIYQTGGSLGMTLLASGTNSAAVNVVSGSHAIHTDVTLGSNTIVDVGSGASLTFHDAIAGAATAGLTKTGLGTLLFNGNSSYAGNTTIAEGFAGLLSGVTPLGSGTVTVGPGATLDLNYRSISNPLVVLSGGILLNSGSGQSLTVSDLVYFSGTTNGTLNVVSGGIADFLSGGVVNASVNVGAGGIATFASGAAGLPSVNVANGGFLTVAGTAAGSYLVAGTGTFSDLLSGDLDVSSGGIVAFEGRNAAGSTFNVASGGLVNVGTSATIGGQLHVSGTAVIAGSVTADADVIVQSGGRVAIVDGGSFGQTSLTNLGSLVVDRSTNLTLATAISGSGGLTKQGSGQLTLTGSSTYTGPTSVNAGGMFVNGSIASAVAVNQESLLGGTGKISGSVTIANSGTLSPGSPTDPLAALTVGDLVLSGSQTVTMMTISGSATGYYDQIVADGPGHSITYAGILDLTMTGTASGGPYDYANLTSFNLFSGFASKSGNFSTVVLHAVGTRYDGLVFAFSDGVWQTDWTNQPVGQRLVFDASSGALLVVPEPATLALAGIGLACLAGAARWRRRTGGDGGKSDADIRVPSLAGPMVGTGPSSI